jgi:hypothetical protein
LSLLVAVGGSPAIAQTSRVGATLEGRVTDSSGAVVPGAEVRLRNTETHQTRTVKADEQGAYRAGELPVGTYEVHVEHPGFAPYVHAGVVLSIGQTVRLDIQLAPAGVSTQVTVTAQPSPMDPSQTSVTTSVDTEKIEELPVRSRNYLQFVLLAPGVSSSSQQASSSTPTPLADSGFTFGGLRARSNNLSIDGLDNNDEFTGASRTELSLEIVREFQVVNNGLSAESGGASGGSVNVVTKTGGNTIHGDAFLFAQGGALNARDPISNETSKPDLSRYRAGFAIGGPLVKERTFYYAAFEQEHARGETASDIDPAAGAAVNNFLSTGAFPRLNSRSIAAGFFPFARAETEASGKFNHQINQQHSLMLRYAFTNNRDTTDAFNTGGLADASARGSSFIADHALVGSLLSLFGSNAVNDFRFQFATRRVTLRTNDAAGPEISIAGVLDFGRPYEGNSRRRENHYQASDTLSLVRGAHLWKEGFAVNRVRLRAFVPDGFGGVYLFASVADFLNGRADSFRQGFGNPATDFAVTTFGAFVQDHWSASRQLTIDLGLRYDFEHLPAGFNQDSNNFSPRVGLAYHPWPRWVFRAGYGVFFDRYVLANLNRAMAEDGRQAFVQVLDGSAAANLFQAAGGGPLGAPVSGLARSFFQADAGMATPYSQQASLGVEYLLTKNLTAGVNYLFVRGVKLPRTRNVNLLSPVVLTLSNAAGLGIPNPAPQQVGRPVFGPGREDPRFTDIYQLEDASSSSYHGVSLALNRRLSNEFEFSVNYTLSRTQDDASDFDEQPEDPFALRAERALSRSHQRHRLVLSALYDLPFGTEEEKKGKPGAAAKGGSKLPGDILGHIELAPILTIASGRPVDPLTGLDSNQSHAFPLAARPLGFGRNALSTPRTIVADLRVLKYFKIGEHGRLDLVAEFFNLFNHVNVSQINPFFGSNLNPAPGFGRPIDASNPRQIQFSIDFEF